MFDNQNNIDILIDQAMDEASFLSTQCLENTPYSLWIEDDDYYTPATNIRTAQKLPSGVYKVVFQDDSYRLRKVILNSDEIYKFSTDFTSGILDEINSFWQKADLYKENHLIHKRGMLLVGSAGTGKTSLITLLVKQLQEQDGIVFLVNNYRDFNLLNECLGPIIRKIEPDRPIVTVIEDIDKLIEENNNNDSELLNFLDGKNSINHHVVIMTSNNTSDLSEAFLRPSRIDMHFEIPNPDDEVRREYFIKKGISEKELEEFVKSSSGMSFAQLKEFFIGVKILGKPIKKVIDQLNNPLNSKDYLTKSTTLGF